MAEIRLDRSLESCCQLHQTQTLSSNYVIVKNQTFESNNNIDWGKQSTPQIEVTDTDNSLFIERFYESLSLFPVSILYPILGIIILVLIQRRKAIDKDLALSKASGICPCKSCQFFSHNPRLYCGVRPLDAMTARAIDCPDYCPTDL